MVNPLINVGPGGPIEAGIMAARHPESAQFWHDAENVAFRDLGIEKAIGPQEPNIISTGVPVVRLAQVQSRDGSRRIYFQDSLWRIFGWDGPGPVFYIGQVSGPAQLLPYGNWLFAACAGGWLWKGEGALVQLDLPTSIHSVAKLANHVVFFGNRLVQWPDVRDPEQFTPAHDKTAGSFLIRDSESDIVAVVPVSNGLGIYSKDTARVLSYRGAGMWFGMESRVLDGIGAVGPNSVCSAGFKNYGLTKNGIFITDGTQFEFVDHPAMHGYLNNNLDWERADEVFTLHNEAFEEVIFFFPSPEGEWKGLGYRYASGGFSKYNIPVRAALPREVFDYPIFGTEDGIALGSDYARSSSYILTKPLDAGDSVTYKFWDYFRFVGEWSGMHLKIGVHDEVNAEPLWIYDGSLESFLHFHRESVFLTLELTGEPDSWFNISQVMVTGVPSGRIF